MIKLVLITGFLGTGKTTLLKSIIEEYKDSRIGVIVNEFGEINIDSKLIKKEGLRIMELSNGSIFCSCLKEDFVKGLIEMSKMDIQYLFIEASGLADPSNMAVILDSISNELYNKYDYRGSVCVLDAENFLKLYEILPSLHNQIEYSSAIIINKSDLVDSKMVAEIITKLNTINYEIDIHITSFCKVDIKRIINGLSKACIQSKNSTNTPETRPKSFVISGELILPFDNLAEFLNVVSKSTYRIKGFAETNQGNVVVSSVGDHVNIEKWNYPIKGTQIVLISSIGIRLISILTKELERNLKDKVYLS